MTPEAFLTELSRVAPEFAALRKLEAEDLANAMATSRKTRRLVATVFIAREKNRTDRARIGQGIARAWANHRAAHPPEQLWAIVVAGGEEHQVEHSLEDALDYAREAHMDHAELRPCEICYPPSLREIADRFIEDIGEDNSAVHDDWHADFANWEQPVIEASLNDITDLGRRFAAEYRRWAIARGVKHLAWKFTGPVRRFEIWSRAKPIEGPFNAVAAGHDWWIELCPLTLGHGAHNCTLPLGHDGLCDPELA